MNEKISQLPNYENPQAGDIIPIVVAATGVTSSITYENFLPITAISIVTDTVSGTINGTNRTFTVPHTITTAIALYLANSVYQVGVDYTTSGTTITMSVAPDASLSGQQFFLVHI